MKSIKKVKDDKTCEGSIGLIQIEPNLRNIYKQVINWKRISKPTPLSSQVSNCLITAISELHERSAETLFLTIFFYCLNYSSFDCIIGRITCVLRGQFVSF